MTYHPGLYADMTVEKLREKQGLSETRKAMKQHRERLRAKLDPHEQAVKGETPEPPIDWWSILAAVSGAIIIAAALLWCLT